MQTRTRPIPKLSGLARIKRTATRARKAFNATTIHSLLWTSPKNFERNLRWNYRFAISPENWRIYVEPLARSISETYSQTKMQKALKPTGRNVIKHEIEETLMNALHDAQVASKEKKR